MRDLTDELTALRTRLAEAAVYLRIEDLRARRPQLETEATRPDLWDDPTAARAVTGELSSVSEDLDGFDSLSGELDDAATLFELATDEEDESVVPEIEASIANLQRRFDALELRSLFTGDYDERDAICDIQSGEGGTDAQDWAEMLLRMYRRWAENRGFEVEVDDVSAGTEAGISSASMIVKGRFAYGLLRAEHGVHRLVRISPFNSQGKRQTAFAAVEATPFMEEVDVDIQIEDKDLRVDLYRSSGAGGQHVNVTDSAVRLTHLPTGIVTSCQNERSQHQNKERAMQVLKAKLAELERQKRLDQIEEIKGVQRTVGFGSQIRSYVLQPYQMVKDLRSEHETGNVEAVLDGALDPFMEAYLRWERSQSLA